MILVGERGQFRPSAEFLSRPANFFLNMKIWYLVPIAIDRAFKIDSESASFHKEFIISILLGISLGIIS